MNELHRRDRASAQEPWPFEPDPELEGVEVRDDEDDTAPPDARATPGPVPRTVETFTAVSDVRPNGPVDAAGPLERAAPLARYGIMALVTLWFLAGVAGRESGLTGRGDSFRALIGVGFGVLGGLLAGRILNGFGALLRLLAEGNDAARTLEGRFAVGMQTLTEAVSAARGPGMSGGPGVESRSTELAGIRRAIQSGQWDDALALSNAFADTHPDDPEAPRVSAELADARAAAARELLAKVEAAREVNDPDRVIELRDALRPLLDSDALRTLDRDLARWFLLTIQRRLRSGTVRADVVALAGRVAERLDDTVEGASLRASLPTLRRAAGLCPRCAQPYKGLADACPACLHTPAPTPAEPPRPPTDATDATPISARPLPPGH